MPPRKTSKRPSARTGSKSKNHPDTPRRSLEKVLRQDQARRIAQAMGLSYKAPRR